MENSVFENVENRFDLLPAILSDMGSSPEGRSALVKALAKNGVEISESDDNELLYTSIYTALATSKNFRSDLKKAVFGYLNEDQFNNFMGNWQINALGQVVDLKTGQVREDVRRTTGLGDKKGKGGFWAGLFSKENASALTNYAINIVGNKLSEKANQKQIQDGIDYQVARTEALEKERLAQEQRKKWIVPVVVVSGIVVVSVIGYLVYRNMKAKKG